MSTRETWIHPVRARAISKRNPTIANPRCRRMGNESSRALARLATRGRQLTCNERGNPPTHATDRMVREGGKAPSSGTRARRLINSESQRAIGLIGPEGGGPFHGAFRGDRLYDFLCHATGPRCPGPGITLLYDP